MIHSSLELYKQAVDGETILIFNHYNLAAEDMNFDL